MGLCMSEEDHRAVGGTRDENPADLGED